MKDWSLILQHFVNEKCRSISKRLKDIIASNGVKWQIKTLPHTYRLNRIRQFTSIQYNNTLKVFFSYILRISYIYTFKSKILLEGGFFIFIFFYSSSFFLVLKIQSVLKGISNFSLSLSLQ